MISFKVNEASLKGLERAIARKVAEVTAQAASIAYNTVIIYDGPVWAGTYRASWQISVGSPGDNRLPLPTNKSGKPDVTYGEPTVREQTPNYSSPFTSIYVSNTVPYAAQIEYDGTPSHPYEGWHIALHAKSQTLQRLRLF